jgi:hypothetical protein
VPDVKINRQIQPQLERLSQMHPASWQITHSDDFYSLKLRFFLNANRSKEPVVLNREQAIGDVIFLPNTYESGFNLQGYSRFRRDSITAFGDFLDVYVKDHLLHK